MAMRNAPAANVESRTVLKRGLAVISPMTSSKVCTLTGEGAVARALREELRASHPGLFTKVQTLDEVIGEMTASPRFNTVLLSTFAAGAFLMAIVGVYVVLA